MTSSSFKTHDPTSEKKSKYAHIEDLPSDIEEFELEDFRSEEEEDDDIRSDDTDDLSNEDEEDDDDDDDDDDDEEEEDESDNDELRHRQRGRKLQKNTYNNTKGTLSHIFDFASCQKMHIKQKHIGYFQLTYKKTKRQKELQKRFKDNLNRNSLYHPTNKPLPYIAKALSIDMDYGIIVFNSWVFKKFKASKCNKDFCDDDLIQFIDSDIDDKDNEEKSNNNDDDNNNNNNNNKKQISSQNSEHSSASSFMDLTFAVEGSRSSSQQPSTTSSQNSTTSQVDIMHHFVDLQKWHQEKNKLEKLNDIKTVQYWFFFCYILYLQIWNLKVVSILSYMIFTNMTK